MRMEVRIKAAVRRSAQCVGCTHRRGEDRRRDDGDDDSGVPNPGEHLALNQKLLRRFQPESAKFGLRRSPSLPLFQNVSHRSDDIGVENLPASDRRMSIASSGVIANRYGLSVVIASYMSDTAAMRATIETSSLRSPAGYPLPSNRSW